MDLSRGSAASDSDSQLRKKDCDSFCTRIPAVHQSGVEFRFESIRRLYYEEFCGGKQHESEVVNVKVETCSICDLTDCWPCHTNSYQPMAVVKKV